MLNRVQELIGMTLGARDGEIGKITDMYFDDQRWVARYLVVETGDWFSERKVLISPISVKTINWDAGLVAVDLSREQVRSSPDIDTARPVSRQHEIDLFNYYGYPSYWSGPLMWGMTEFPFLPLGTFPAEEVLASQKVDAAEDRHLRSAHELIGYHLQATDEAIGHLEDLLLDHESWSIRYLMIDTRNWWPGRHVVIPPQWIENLDWAERRLKVSVSRSQVLESPKYDPAADFSRELESDLHRHYDRPGYWF